MKKYYSSDDLVAKALCNYAIRVMEYPGTYLEEEVLDLDRALRSCKGISDIDRIWVRWSYFCEKHGWTTTDEMKCIKGTYRYPVKT